MVRVPFVPEVGVGVKVMPIVQNAEIARVAPQSLVTAYTGLLTVIVPRVMRPMPEFVRVTVFAALVVSSAWVKEREVGFRLAVERNPVPESETLCGLPGALLTS